MKDVDKIEQLLNDLTTMQQGKVLQCANHFIPTLTQEDVLQPVDYPELENNPHFRYEEGILAGIQTVHSALLALFKETSN